MKQKKKKEDEVNTAVDRAREQAEGTLDDATKEAKSKAN